MENIIETITAYGLKILFAAAIFIVGRWLARKISEIVERGLLKSNTEPALATFLKNLIYFGLFAFAIIAALSKLGIQTASFVAVLGAAGLAVGLALQGSLSNFAAGVMILLFKPFKIGDFVNAGGVAGTIKEIQIFSTILATPDNVKIIIPNAQISSGAISNFSANDTRRVDMVIGVGYDDDLNKASEVITSCLEGESRILKDPAYTVAVSELADSSVNFVVRPWVNAADYWGVKFDLTKKIKEELESNGLSIPYPQTDIHLKGEGISISSSQSGETVAN